MNLILPQNESLTMTSGQIAKLLELRHDNVRQAAKNLESHGAITFTETSVKGVGRPKLVMHFDKRNSIIIAAKLNANFMVRIIDRWLHLESGYKPALPQNYLEALESLVAKEKQLIEQAPKVEFVNRFIESTGNKSFRQVAKILKANEREFRAFLSDSKVMYQLGGGWTAHAKHIDAGRFYATAGESNGHAYTECKFTPKGIEYIAGKWIAHKEIV